MPSSEVRTGADVNAIPSPHVRGIVLNCDIVRKSIEATIKIILAHCTRIERHTEFKLCIVNFQALLDVLFDILYHDV